MSMLLRIDWRTALAFGTQAIVTAALVGAASVAALPLAANAGTEFCPSGNVVFDSDFSGNWIARFGKGVQKPVFVGQSYWQQVQQGSDTCLRVHYKGGTAGSQNGMFFRMPLTPADRYCTETMFMLKPGFTYNHSGKLIGGLRGGQTAPGKTPTGYDGFSSRPTWDNKGRAVAYVYYPDQYMWGGYGDTFPFGYIPSGRLHTIRQELILNTPGQHNGINRYWLNGVLGWQKTNLRFRNVSSLKIDQAPLETFFGGAAADQGPRRDEYIDFCHVRVCKL
jgi:hypothetical protein